LVVLGTTGAGKSRLAIELAQALQVGTLMFCVLGTQVGK
jgi:tRNA A37 N6-isopentenylltransferase MiaA